VLLFLSANSVVMCLGHFDHSCHGIEGQRSRLGLGSQFETWSVGFQSLIGEIFLIFTVRGYAKCGICRRRVSVCVCVCHTPVLYQNGQT